MKVVYALLEDFLEKVKSEDIKEVLGNVAMEVVPVSSGDVSYNLKRVVLVLQCWKNGTIYNYRETVSEFNVLDKEKQEEMNKKLSERRNQLVKIFSEMKVSLKDGWIE